MLVVVIVVPEERTLVVTIEPVGKNIIFDDVIPAASRSQTMTVSVFLLLFSSVVVWLDPKEGKSDDDDEEDEEDFMSFCFLLSLLSFVSLSRSQSLSHPRLPLGSLSRVKKDPSSPSCCCSSSFFFLRWLCVFLLVAVL